MADAIPWNYKTRKAEVGMSELFNIPEQKSPRLQWLDKHGIWTCEVTLRGKFQWWEATASGIIGKGATEDDAIVDLAKQMGIKLWNES